MTFRDGNKKGKNMKLFTLPFAVLFCGALFPFSTCAQAADVKPLKVLDCHREYVPSVVFSPDGTILANVSGNDKGPYVIQLWNVNTGRGLRTWTASQSLASSVAFSPDGKMLASEDGNDSVKLWNVSTGSEIRTLTAQMWAAYSVAFSPDGKMLASGDGDYSIRLWDVSTGGEIRTLTGHQSMVFSVVFSPDGKMLASGGCDSTVKLWDVRTGGELLTLTGHQCMVSSVVFSPDGKMLASGGYDSTVKLWDVGTGSEICTLRGHSAIVWSVVFSPDGKMLASGGFDSTIKLWDVRTESEMRTFRGHGGRVFSVAFSPDGTLLASGDDSHTIKLWNIQGREKGKTQKAKPSIAEDTSRPERGYRATLKKGVRIRDGRDATGSQFFLSNNTTVQILERLGDWIRVRFDDGKEGWIYETEFWLVENEITKNIVPPTSPPNVSYKVDFGEPSGNNLLDATEEARISIKLSNTGMGSAYGLSVKLSPEYIAGLAFTPDVFIGDIGAGQSKEVPIPLSASFDVGSKEVSLALTFSESNGFPPPPTKITFSTKAFVPPKLEVADVGIEDARGTGRIEPGELVKVIARIQNTGAGKAEDVTASVDIGENVFLTPDSKAKWDYALLNSGEYKDVSFTIFANQKATSVPVFISLSEKYNKFGMNKFPLPLEFNKTLPRMQEIVVQGKSDEEKKALEPTSALSIDIEQNIPRTTHRNPHAVALIIAISDYANSNLPRVEYAKRDAEMLREYLVRTLGYDEKNILPMNSDELMTFATMRTYVKSKLPSYLKKDGSSDLFVYYTGHGAPNTSTNEAFFVPYDCDPSFVNSDNAYNMNEFYADIANLKARSKIVVVDACFSGQDGSGRTLVKNASPALLKVNNALLAGENSVLFQSSSADQVSNWYPAKKHGMFTYFFLKGIQGAADTSHVGLITAQELETYINDPNEGLPYFSNREFQRPQKAVVSGNKKQVIVKLKGE